MHPRDQTIFALSSGRLPSAIALVRVSGPQAGKIVTTFAGKTPSPRMATRALLRDVGQRPIDVRKPTTPVSAAGARTEPPASLPSAQRQLPSQSETPAPELDPPLMR